MESSLFTKGKIYEIAYSVENGYERKDLNDDEGKEIITAMNDLQVFSNVCIYAYCIKASIKELKDYLLSLKFNQHSYIDFANAQRLTLNMLHMLTFSVYVLLFFLIRDLAGYGTFTFFGKGHQIFEKVIISPDNLGFFSLLASIPGALIFSSVLLFIHIFVRNKFDILFNSEENK